MPRENASVEITSRPISDETARVEQGIERANDAIVVELDARNAPLPHRDRVRESGECAGIDG